MKIISKISENKELKILEKYVCEVYTDGNILESREGKRKDS